VSVAAFELQSDFIQVLRRIDRLYMDAGLINHLIDGIFFIFNIFCNTHGFIPYIAVKAFLGFKIILNTYLMINLALELVSW